jgi:hypothetical protein
VVGLKLSVVSARKRRRVQGERIHILWLGVLPPGDDEPLSCRQNDMLLDLAKEVRACHMESGSISKGRGRLVNSCYKGIVVAAVNFKTKR